MSFPGQTGCRPENTAAGRRMIRASAGAAELGSVRPLASACGPGVAAEPTPPPARRGSSPCCRSRPRSHEAPARASALRRPAPPRCYRPDMAPETLPFRSAGSRRRRRPRHSGTGTAPCNAVSQDTAHRRPDWLEAWRSKRGVRMVVSDASSLGAGLSFDAASRTARPRVRRSIRRSSSTYVGIAKYWARPHDEYGEIGYSGLPIKPIHVRYHQTHQGISDTPELPIIHQVPDAPMMR
jgi:hypothetical protein